MQPLISPATIIIDKEFFCRNCSLEISQVKLPDSRDHSLETFYQSLFTATPSAVVVNPFHVELKLSILQEHSEVPQACHPLLNFTRPQPSYRIEIEMKFNNLEINPSLSQLHLLTDSYSHVFDLLWKYKSQFFRPQLRPTQQPKEWWKYAMKCVLIRKNGKVTGYPENNWAIGYSSHVPSHVRERYIELYAKYLLSQNQILHSATLSSPSSSQLAEDEISTLDELHHSIDWGSLLVFRLLAHRRISGIGIPLTSSPKETSKTNPSSSIWNTLYSALTANYDEVDDSPHQEVFDDPHSEMKSMFWEVRRIMAERTYHNSILINATLKFPRLALSLEGGNSSNSFMTSRLVMLVIYGGYVNFQQGRFLTDGSCSIRLGAIRLFGLDGLELVSCGQYTDEWFSFPLDIDREKICEDQQPISSKDLALTIHYQWSLFTKSTSNPQSPANLFLRHLSSMMKRHMFLEFTLNHTAIYWDRNTIDQFFNGYSSWIRSCGPDLTNPEKSSMHFLKRLCSEYSMNKTLNSLKSNIEGIEWVNYCKWSVNLILLGFKFRVPVVATSPRTPSAIFKSSQEKRSAGLLNRPLQSNKGLEDSPTATITFCVFSFGTFTVLSGDYLKNFELVRANSLSLSTSFSVTGIEPKSSTSDVNPSQEFDPSSLIDSSFWGNKEHIIQRTIGSQSGMLVQHCVVSCQDVEIIISHPNLEDTNLTDIPFHFQILLSLSSAKTRQCVPDISLAIFCSSLHFNFTPTDIIKVTEAFQRVYVPIPRLQPTRRICYRLKSLSPLCQIKFQTFIDKFQCNILTNDSVNASLLRKELITKYYDTLTERGPFSRVTHTMERNLGQQLQYLGVDLRCIDEIFSILSAASELEQTQELHSTTIRQALERLIIDRKCGYDMSRPIFSITFLNTQIIYTKLSYDSRLIFVVGEVAALDQDFNTIFHSFPREETSIPNLPANPKKLNLEKKNSSKISDLLDNVDSISAAFTLSYTTRHQNYTWGVGGEPHSVLYGTFDSRVNEYPEMGEFTIQSQNIDLLMTPFSLPNLFKALVTLLDEFSRGAPTARRMDELQSPSSTSFVYNLKCECLHFVFISENRNYFAETIFTSLDLNLGGMDQISSLNIDSLNLENVDMVDSEGIQNQGLWFRIGTIELYDLTTYGSLHPSIITKDQSIGPIPMLILRIILLPNKTDITLRGEGFRFLLLTRFGRELHDFLLHKFYKAFIPDYESYVRLLNLLFSDEYLPGKKMFKSELSIRGFLWKLFKLLFPKSQRKIFHKFRYATQFVDPSSQSFPQLSFTISSRKTTLIFPRNSLSDDLFGITVDSVHYEYRRETETWTLVPKMKVSDPNECLYFDTGTNSWKWSEKYPHADLSPRSGSDQSSNIPPTFQTETVFIPQFDSQLEQSLSHSPSPQTLEIETKKPFGNSLLSRLFDHQDSFSTSSEENSAPQPNILNFEGLLTDKESFMEHLFSLNESKRMSPPIRRPSSTIQRVTIDIRDLESDDSLDEFHDAVMESTPTTAPAAPSLPAVTPAVSTGESHRSSLKHSSLHKMYTTFEDDYFPRHIFELENLQFFVSKADTDYSGLNSYALVHRRFLGLSSLAPVYSEILEDQTSSHSNQMWKRVTESPFHSLLVCDVVENKLRFLLTDTPNPSSIHCFLSIAEYCLIQSIYTDNFREQTQFEKTLDIKSTETKGEGAPSLFPYPDYGTKEYFDFVRQSQYQIEFHLVRHEILLDLMMCSNFFPEEIHSLQFLTSQPAAEDNIDHPFLGLQMKWISFHAYGGKIARQFSLGVGDLLLVDTRTLDRAHGGHFLRLSQNIENGIVHGYSRFNYGESFEKFSSPDLPFQCTFLQIILAWSTIHLELDHPDFDLKNIELFYLIRDFFLLYDQNILFGNPKVRARSSVDSKLWPYNGVDLRCFVVKPHFQIAEGSLPSSNSLIIECEDNLYLRLLNDSISSYQIEFYASNLVIVLLKSYKLSTATIGLRGTAGSGLGVRTILEGCNLKAFAHSDQEIGHIDFQMSIQPYIQSEILDVFTPYHDENFLSSPASPHLRHSQITSRNYPASCCHVVLSSDDFLTIKRILSCCLMCDLEELSSKFYDAAMPKESSSQSSLPSLFAILHLRHVRFLIVDNVLGLHLPLTQAYFTNLDATIDFRLVTGSKTEENNIRPQLMSSYEGCFWIDVFNTTLKCWEPLSEPISWIFLHEKSAERGEGFALKFNSEIHINLSVPILRTLDDILKIARTHTEAQARDSRRTKSHTYGRKSNFGTDIHEVTKFNRQLGSQFTSHLDIQLKRSISNELETKNETILDHSSQFIPSREKAVTFEKNQESLQPVLIDHVPTMPLPSTARVGFAILNLTGYPIRYFQVWENGNIRTIQYLDSGQRGLLNFIASKTLMRDNEIVEVQFDVQKQSVLGKSNKKSIGHYVSLQIAGFKWLRHVQADTLGVRFEDIHPVIGLMDLRKAYPTNLAIQHTVKLVTEVRQHGGGRLLQLNSVFLIKNSTFHSIQLLTNETSTLNTALEDTPFTLSAGESFYIPIALLYRSILKSNANSLGYVWLKPSNNQPIIDELGIPAHMISEASYTVDPINLMNTVERTLALISKNQSTGLLHETADQLSCKLLEQSGSRKSSKFSSTRHLFNNKGPKIFDQPERESKEDEVTESSPRNDQYLSARILNLDRLPAFCYNIEIESLSTSTQQNIGPGNNIDNFSETDGSESKVSSNNDQRKNQNFSPRIYSIVIHPPIVLENLLPMIGTFELVREDKTVLWSAVIEPGKSRPVHTVAMDSSIFLILNLEFCRSSEGALVHVPDDKKGGRSVAGAVFQSFEDGWRGLLEENNSSKTSTSITLEDSVGQKLRLQIENKLGGGGHRNISIYCPYWVVNTSQYTLRLKEDGSPNLPAGTVTMDRDIRRSVSTDNGLKAFSKFHRSLNESGEISEEKFYPGLPGPLHSTVVKEIKINSTTQNLLSDLKFEQMMRMSTLFNFQEDEDSKLIGTQKVIAQLDDSNWSNSFTLESAGVNQVLSVDHPEKGMLELSFRISSPPGKLAVYTKIIRFSPRFVVLNKLPVSAKVLQVNGFFHEKVPIQVSPDYLRPFHLPAVFGERQISINVDGPWSRSIGFEIDQLGTHFLRLRKLIDPSALEHIMTRGTPEYDVSLPPGEVGIWFETDWTHQQIVVMRIKSQSFAALRTDIQPGDVLLRIGSESVENVEFDIVMGKIKDLLSKNGCTLTLQTVEEKMRLIRATALAISPTFRGHFSAHLPQEIHLSRRFPATPLESHQSLNFSRPPTIHQEERSLKEYVKEQEMMSEAIIEVQMKAVDSSIFMILSELPKNFRPEYRIVNSSSGYVIHYRQKGIYGGRWGILDPGESIDYIFDDPTKPRSLLLRVGKYLPCPFNERTKSLPTIDEHPLSCISVNSTDVFVSQVLFDEIGVKGILSIPGTERKLDLVVKSEGPTKVLKINMEESIREMELLYTFEFINEQIKILREFSAHLRDLENQVEEVDMNATLSQFVIRAQEIQSRCQERAMSRIGDYGLFSSQIVPFNSLFGPTITHTNQIIVEVIQATGLKSASIGGTDESYCEISLKCGNLLLRDEYRQQQSTYVNDQTSDPYWVDQIFFLDVPVQPSDSIRGYYVRARMKSRSIVGRDTFLGEADIPLSSLVSENEICGWFALKPKNYSVQTSSDTSLVSGSLKLRVQWIHSMENFSSYLTSQTERYIQFPRTMTCDRRVKVLETQSKLQRTQLEISSPENNVISVLPQSISEQQPTQDEEYESIKLLSRRRSSSTRPVSVRRKSRRTGLGSGDLSGIIEPDSPGISLFSSSTQFHRDQFLEALEARRYYPKNSNIMKRHRKIAEMNGSYQTLLDTELHRNFEIVKTAIGILEITPIRAVNMPHCTQPIFVSLMYGDERYQTMTAFPSNCTEIDESKFFTNAPNRTVYEWNTLNSPSNQGGRRLFCNFNDATYNQLAGIVPTFSIDTLNIRGNINITLVEEKFPHRLEYASIEIPIFHLLEFVDRMQTNDYCMWFPLVLLPALTTTPNVVSPLLPSLTPDENNPCICLRLKWKIPESRINLRVPKIYYRFQIPLVSISIIDATKVREIMQIIVSGIEGKHLESPQNIDQSLHITWFQVDNQLYSAFSSTIVAPTCVYHPQPSLRMYLSQNTQLSVDSTPSYDKMEFIIQEIDLYLEQQVVAALWEIEQVIRRERLLFYNTTPDTIQSPGPSQFQPFDQNDSIDLTSQIETESTKLYVEHFYISPIVVNVSFIASPKSTFSQTITTEVLSERSTIDANITRENSPLLVFLWQVGEVVLDLSSSIPDAPIKLNGLAIDYMFRTWYDITSTLREHYLNSALGQIYRIVGSLDLVNSPVGLLSSLGTGVRDFFYEPAFALISHPTELTKIGQGVMKGAVSLASNTADGIIGTTTVMTRSVGKGVAFFAKDEVFFSNREILNRHPHTISGLFLRPFRDIGNGLYCGVVGVVRVPYEDAKTDGFPGFITGIGKGLAGLGAKPIIGVLDAVTHAGEGVREIVKSLKQQKGIPTQRKRYPSVFGIDGRLLPYNKSAAHGAYLIHLIDSKRIQETTSIIRDKIQSFSEEKISGDFFPIKFFGQIQKDSEDLSNSPSLNWTTNKSKRRRSIIDPTSEVFSLEGVIYATVLVASLPPHPPTHLCVILTTKRVIITDILAEKDGNSARILWRSSLKDLEPPLMTHEDGLISLLFSQHHGEEFTVVSEDSVEELITELYLVVNILLYQFDFSTQLSAASGENSSNYLVRMTSLRKDFQYLQEHYRVDPHEKIISLGSWQYSQNKGNISSVQEVNDIESLILNNLENSSWKIDSISKTTVEKSNHIPRWLQQDREFVISSHDNILNLLEMSEYNPNDNSTITICKQNLRDGCMTAEEFTIFIEKEKLFGSAIHQLDGPEPRIEFQIQTNLPSEPIEKSTASLGLTAIRKATKRVRNSVYSTLFRQKSDSQISELSSTCGPGHSGSYAQLNQMDPILPTLSIDLEEDKAEEKGKVEMIETRFPVLEDQQSKDQVEDNTELKSDSIPENIIPSFQIHQNSSQSTSLHLERTPISESKGTPTMSDMMEKMKRVENLMAILASTPDGAQLFADLAAEMEEMKK